MVRLLIRPAPPTGPGPATASGQVAARHEASHSGGHTRGHQPQPSTFGLRWRSSQTLRRLSAHLEHPHADESAYAESGPCAHPHGRAGDLVRLAHLDRRPSLRSTWALSRRWERPDRGDHGGRGGRGTGRAGVEGGDAGHLVGEVKSKILVLSAILSGRTDLGMATTLR